ncbi:hypothetical protein GCM10007424_27670 [Flavobacterium suaedae]|uniref:2TM domain-containing protein n=2 Tax=Flavobacterium suaedae TaxID=1767027 RepID=A0ABQ1K6T2_9FLAO|nr:hypothetical protein GCM10007424_27670 [Flavobacterium suaedae]
MKEKQNMNKENSFIEDYRYERAKKRVRSIKGFYIHLLVYVLFNSVSLIIKWVSKDSVDDFLTINTFGTPIFWGFAVLFHAIGVFASTLFLGNNWEDKKLREFMQDEEDKSSKWE